ncbi:HAAAP family serine/threonine permease [Legionella taurinensis]|uniref:HAAAP family serine/threonine permease n=1 Tax=Legionella taurinensis TaxID=70611 RepID=A0A3A5L1W6_9GAMM|nr:serine/threonine transporter [Legionella taurinensis]MDX1836098.1 serine/threonine transporter [Legionella taurinensis]PUT42127.1 HAAAP family serine/threonine permease [Legionella taurinensis]PUT44914.1 HAAAP family serine/threonine permease [Legionella taurinensis]PUT48236.1 HAAAP family serine/threonine permease [Legionella taurinensis]PUT49049.1 HAAAP family serine/threonine permease [Legionella taurinensis]
MSSHDAGVVTTETSLKVSEWQKQDTIWMLGLYGTAIGAGVLFLPIDAGMNGLWPLLIMAVLAFPMTYFSHRALCRFVLSGSKPKADITAVVDEHFGALAGKVLTFLYFFAIYPLLLMYSVAITNTTQSFLINQLGITPPSRAVLSITLILALMAVIRVGQQFVVKAMSVLVYPFITMLMLLALYLIPHWNGAILNQSAAIDPNGHGLLMCLWLIIPVMVFSFNHSPIISSFAVHQKQQYGQDADRRSNQILRYSHLMMVVTVLFFVFSCVFSLSPQDLAEAKRQNITILSYLANHFNNPLIAYAAPCIAFIAISKSFLGHYLGASEGMHGLLIKSMAKKHIEADGKRYQLYLAIDIFIIITCWIVATINPSILRMIETLGGPVIAMILFLLPMYALLKVPAMKPYRHRITDGFITVIGLIAISAILYGLISW